MDGIISKMVACIYPARDIYSVLKVFRISIQRGISPDMWLLLTSNSSSQDILEITFDRLPMNWLLFTSSQWGNLLADLLWDRSTILNLDWCQRNPGIWPLSLLRLHPDKTRTFNWNEGTQPRNSVSTSKLSLLLANETTSSLERLANELNKNEPWNDYYLDP